VRLRGALLVMLALAAVVAAAAGCGRAGGTSSQRVSAWADQSGIVGLDQTIAYDVHGVQGSAAEGKLLTTKTVCLALYDDVSQAYTELPSPDPTLTNLLNQSDLSLSRGADDCSSALSGSRDETLLHRALHEIGQGSADLASATSRLAGFGVETAGTT
jgi:hypothetical protein